MKISDMSVTLLGSYGSDLDVVNAARVSFDKESWWDEEEECFLSKNDQKLIKYLADHNHWSPFSHTSLSFRIKAPIFIARQFAKHQVGGAWNEVSRRYVDSEPEFWFPKEWRARAENKKQGSSEETIINLRMQGFSEQTVDDAVDKLVEHSLDLYKDMLEAGVCPEQARMVLPQNTMSEWIWTGSLFFFARVCNLRLEGHAQKECSEIAGPILQHMKDLFPVSTEALVRV